MNIVKTGITKKLLPTNIKQFALFTSYDDDIMDKYIIAEDPVVIFFTLNLIPGMSSVWLGHCVLYMFCKAGWKQEVELSQVQINWWV